MVMSLSEHSKVYEALGDYVHSLCHSLYLGTARGSAVFYGERRVPLTAEGSTPFISIFYSKGEFEILSIDGEHSLNLRMGPKSVSYDGSSETIEIAFSAPGGNEVIVILRGDREFFKTLKGAVESCRAVKNEKLELTPGVVGVEPFP